MPGECSSLSDVSRCVSHNGGFLRSQDSGLAGRDSLAIPNQQSRTERVHLAAPTVMRTFHTITCGLTVQRSGSS